MGSIIGFKEKFGNELVKEDFVKRSLTDTAHSFGYEQIVVPIIERASSFSEAVVGHSPWPEWNKKGCFYLDIANYEETYNSNPIIEKALLIPEGTVSVSRWLGDVINEKNAIFPIRLFYSIKCFRNELLCEVNNIKRREFEQFGMEILGSSSTQSDAEIIYLVGKCLLNLQVKKESIRIRINDVAIFNMLSNKSNFNIDDITVLKEKLDYLAESKAGKHPEKKDKTIKEIIEIIDKYSLDDFLLKEWNYIIYSDYNFTASTYKTFSSDFHCLFDNLQNIKFAFARIGILIDIDLCVIRSHEYYTGVSFEVDVITNKHFHFEIAGGGRYDRLVRSFIKNKNKRESIESVPCTGFAFGIERVIALLEEQCQFTKPQLLKSVFDFTNTIKRSNYSSENLDDFLLELVKIPKE